MYQSKAKQNIINVAEKHFSERGYQAVVVKDIAKDVGVKHPTLYHHFPNGKEEIYVAVMEQMFARHEAGLQSVIEGAEPTLRSQLLAVAYWFLEHPPINAIRFTRQDLPALKQSNASRLLDISLQSTITPIHQILVEAEERGETQHANIKVAGLIFGMIQSIYAVPHTHDELLKLGEDAIDFILHGLLR